MKTKAEIRAKMRVRRSALTLDEIATRSKAAIEQLETLDILKSSTKMACYLSKPFEVQTQRFIESCVKAGKKVCVPRHIDDELSYAWSWTDPSGAWRDGPWHIAEPAQFNPVDPAELELAIVPAVAVDGQGNRLGHGGGNFDRLLRPVRAPHVGLVFDFQVVDEVPSESHDVPVEWIVTETEVRNINR